MTVARGDDHSGRDYLSNNCSANSTIGFFK